jgi:hypothetical protein
MSESKHTPGPWTVDWSDDGPLIYTGDLLIASVSGSSEHIEVRGLDEQTTEANALLIAAAPDLVAALERVLEHSRQSRMALSIPRRWRVSDVLGRTVSMSSDKVGRLFTYHGPVRRPDEPKDLEDDAQD